MSWRVTRAAAARAAVTLRRVTRARSLVTLPLLHVVRSASSASLSSSSALLSSSSAAAAAACVNVQSSEYVRAAREVQSLSHQAFAHRASSLRAGSGDRAQSMLLLHVYLHELLRARVAHVSTRVLQHCIHLAHSHGYHAECLALYHARRQQVSNGGLGDDNAMHADNAAAGDATAAHATGRSFVASPDVIDSAFVLRDHAELMRLASYCAHCITAQRRPQHSGATAPRETMAELSLLRVLWRVVCLADAARRAEAQNEQARRGVATRAVTDALRIAALCCDALRRASHGSHIAGGASSADGGVRPLDDADAAAQLLLQRALRAVRYDTSGDDGEMQFMQLCVREGLLVDVDTPHSAGAEGGSSTSSTDVIVRDAEQIYAALIDSCRVGKHVQQAAAYAAAAHAMRVAVEQRGGAAAAISALASATTHAHNEMSVVVGGSGSSLTPPARHNGDAASHVTADDGDGDGGSRHGHDDGRGVMLAGVCVPVTRIDVRVVHRLLYVLQAARANHAIAAVARALLRAGRREWSISMWTTILVASGEARAGDVAMAAHDTAVQRLTTAHAGSDSGSNDGKSNKRTSRLLGSDNDDIDDFAHGIVDDDDDGTYVGAAAAATTLPVAHGANNAGGDDTGHGSVAAFERRAAEYLLQTALATLARCNVPGYEERYLQPARDAGWLHCNDAFYYACLLQDAYGHTAATERTAAIVERMRAAHMPLSETVVTRLLRTYLRYESDEFLPLYKRAVRELPVFRAVWVNELVIWAHRRRYALRARDRAYVVREAQQRLKTTAAAAARAAPHGRDVADASGDASASAAVTGGMTAHIAAAMSLLPSALRGQRAYYAMLVYDKIVQSREHFVRHGVAPQTPPPLLDPHLYCLRTKTPLLLRGCASSASVCRVARSTVSAHAYKARAARVAYLSGIGLLTESSVGDAALSVSCAQACDNSNESDRRQGDAVMCADGTRAAQHARQQQQRQATLRMLQNTALRVYLADMLDGLQRSRNHTT